MVTHYKEKANRFTTVWTARKLKLKILDMIYYITAKLLDMQQCCPSKKMIAKNGTWDGHVRWEAQLQPERKSVPFGLIYNYACMLSNNTPKINIFSILAMNFPHLLNHIYCFSVASWHGKKKLKCFKYIYAQIYSVWVWEKNHRHYWSLTN